MSNYHIQYYAYGKRVGTTINGDKMDKNNLTFHIVWDLSYWSMEKIKKQNLAIKIITAKEPHRVVKEIPTEEILRLRYRFDEVCHHDNYPPPAEECDRLFGFSFK